MGLRFRRAIKIAPGIRLNVSKSGVGVSAGPRGARIGVGPRGVHRSVGLPGTGLHYREQLGWGSSSASRTAAGGNVGVQIVLNDDGSVHLLDEQDQQLPPRLVRQLREQREPELKRWLEKQCEKWNRGIDQILNLHHYTPDPEEPLVFEPEVFEEPEPPPYRPRPLGLLGRIWQSRRERIEAENRRGLEAFQESLEAWRERKQAHERLEAERRERFEVGRLQDVDAMEEILGERLARLEWPRETSVSFELGSDGAAVMLDVDLPEIEDMPPQQAVVAARGLKINIKDKSDAQVRKEYAQHVHAVLFRLIGEVFVTLPTAETVVASGYSQRPDPATGEIRDDYLVSARVPRVAWRQINFGNLPAIELFASFERFELRRKMTKTGHFTPIQPFDAPVGAGG